MSARHQNQINERNALVFDFIQSFRQCGKRLLAPYLDPMADEAKSVEIACTFQAEID